MITESAACAMEKNGEINITNKNLRMDD